jgi:16S rRNA (adenine1518-N6/adenine1519-N6)-dimethyltransferase
VEHRPKKSLGQNFLVDQNLQKKIVQALDPLPEDEILEIGPGRGALTRHLAGRCRGLILVELDRDLAASLETTHAEDPSVRVLQRDILEVHPSELSDDVGKLKVIGNIPYNITSPILFHLLTRPRPSVILLMVQKEVGERALAQAGTSAFGALTVGVQSVATVERALKVPAQAFRPVPKVESVVIRIVPLDPPLLSADEERELRSLTRTAFQQRRKQFQSILRNHSPWRLDHQGIANLEEETGFDLRRRPETFTPADFIRLSRALSSLGPFQG